MNDSINRWAHRLAPEGWMLLAVALFVLLMIVLPANGQTTPAPIQKCLPGFYGKQWPGTDFNTGTRTSNGWYAFVFCDAGGGRLYPRMTVCAHGECASQVVYGAALGRLQIESFAAPDKAAVFEAAPEARRDFTCGPFDVPAGGVQPYESPPANPPVAPLPTAEPGSARALICADAFAAIKAKWPMAAVVTPPPPPPPPPPPGPTVYVVTGAQAFPLNADGTRSVTPIAQAPIKGSTCDCVAKQIVTPAGSRYCAVQIPNVSQLIVAGCSVKK